MAVGRDILTGLVNRLIQQAREELRSDIDWLDGLGADSTLHRDLLACDDKNLLYELASHAFSARELGESDTSSIH